MDDKSSQANKIATLIVKKDVGEIIKLIETTDDQKVLNAITECASSSASFASGQEFLFDVLLQLIAKHSCFIKSVVILKALEGKKIADSCNKKFLDVVNTAPLDWLVGISRVSNFHIDPQLVLKRLLAEIPSSKQLLNSSNPQREDTSEHRIILSDVRIILKMVLQFDILDQFDSLALLHHMINTDQFEKAVVLGKKVPQIQENVVNLLKDASKGHAYRAVITYNLSHKVTILY